ncbi:DUF6113 family protein [Streptomyces sp. HNM0574]|uniref:DUF6113 family protein n=1 Tax=Streptomyces sp. HNM0574 TaxID=2714954 RepID=UPI00146ED6DE|nr:DUF6113 family protein [Streptomyces sp. HNM0574]NLU67319.1 hypothetical protein [Streptomyces sp. HNM0574]
MSNARTGAGGSPAARTGSTSVGDWPRPVPERRGARFAVYGLLGVLGLLAGAAGALLQSAWFPGGLVLSLAAAAGLFWGGGKLCRTKVGAVAPGTGWALAVWFLTTTRPEGDFVFGAGLGSYVFLLGGTFAAVMCATIALPAPPSLGRKSP